jgi:hypothetical protein
LLGTGIVSGADIRRYRRTGVSLTSIGRVWPRRLMAGGEAGARSHQNLIIAAQRYHAAARSDTPAWIDSPARHPVAPFRADDSALVS